jgi:outer membrane protein assembly factor BamB
MRDEANNASPSPSTDGKFVWALTGVGDMACFDVGGKEIWRCNLQDRYGEFKQNWGGIHMSPLLDGDRLYLSLLHAKGAWVIALNKNTGTEIWKIARQTDATGESKESYASPVIWRNGKEECLITQGGDYAVGHRLEDGAEIWRVGGLNPKERYNRTYRFVATPAVSKDVIVVPSCKDGAVAGVRADAKGLVLPGNKEYELWRKPKITPDVPSPLIYDGLVYFGDKGFLNCVEAKTGKEMYMQAQIHRNARYRGSPVYADGKIYWTARDGVVTVVKAGPKFEKLAENRFSDQISASPAVSGGRIYFRGFAALYAVGIDVK